MSENTALEILAKKLSPELLVTEPDVLATYGLDRTKQWPAQAKAVCFPKSTDDVQAIVRWANEQQIALVPSGGRTGLSGGAVASNGEVVVSFDKMNRILDFNEADRTVTCEAGLILQQLQEFAETKDLLYPVDYASKGSVQMGGSIATNAGGIKVIRYGNTRDWVAGLKVVTGQGEVLELNKGLVKNNSGYDLRQLFIGSEGTLGFITEATLNLARPEQDLSVLVLGVENLESIIDLLKLFQSEIDLTAFEFFSHNGMEKVMAHSQVPAPFTTATPYYALIEFDQASQRMEQVMTLFEAAVEKGWVVDGVISQSQSQAENLWCLREDLSETMAQWQPYKNDVAVPVSHVPEFVVSMQALLNTRYPNFEVVLWGHIGDGNIHINILKPTDLAADVFYEQCHSVSDELFTLIQSMGGSISAEHGVGLLKKDYLTYTRSEEEINLMRGIKRVFDPNGIMNPGKVF